MAVKIKRETPPSNIYDYSPPDSLQYGQIAQDAVGNIYSADRSNNIVKQMSSTANAQVGNPNLLYNGSLSVNQRGQTSYLQSWGGRYTLSAKVDGTVYSKSFYLGNTSYSDAYDMGSFYFTYEKYSGVSTWWFGIGVVPGETGPGSVTIEWVKLEKGAQATNYTPKSYLDELTACQRYFVKIATWQMLGNGYVDWEGKNAYIQIPTASTMRVDPTCSTISGAFYCGDGTTFSVTNVAPSATVRPGWVVLHFTGTFGHANQTCCFITSDTQTTLSAEI